MPVSSAPYFRLLVAILERRRAVVAAGLVVGVLTIVVGLLGPRSYTAEASFFPRTRRATATASGLAAQLGLTLPTSDLTEGLAFFDQLLRTRDVLDSALVTTYRFSTDTGAVTADLLSLLKVKGDSAQRQWRGRRALLRAFQTSTDYKTGILSLEVQASHPQLAVLISQRLLTLVDNTNRVTRRGQATAEREFTEHRLTEVRADLRAAEDRLQLFLSRNRDVRNSAQLTFEQERLQREVSLRQQVYTSLSQAYEQARIEEVRDTPVLTIVQPPRVPEFPDGRALAIKGIVAFLLGALLAIAAVVAGGELRQYREREPMEYAALDGLRRETLRDLRRPWRFLGVGR